jgi:xyloglucan-specific exo-beta-1,4-glucanase
MLEGMTKATRMGFGMPAPGSKQPAIFISAIAAGLEGTFRSLDGGQSWIRVDDKDHQFGWKNAVIGDPRVFGRSTLRPEGGESSMATLSRLRRRPPRRLH